MFVCTGNICRSPTADAILRHLIQHHPEKRHFDIQSSGLGNWHVGHPPDRRSVRAALKRGYTLIQDLRAQQITEADFGYYDLILALDDGHFQQLQQICPAPHQDKIKHMLDYAPEYGHSVPDPYYDDDSAFEDVLNMLEAACQNLYKSL